MAYIHKTHINPNWPVWYLPEAPLGAAARYIASLSPRVHWVGIYVKMKKKYVLKASMGDRKNHFQNSEHNSEISLPIQSSKKKETGKIILLSHSSSGFTKSELQMFQK